MLALPAHAKPPPLLLPAAGLVSAEFMRRRLGGDARRRPTFRLPVVGACCYTGTQRLESESLLKELATGVCKLRILSF